MRIAFDRDTGMADEADVIITFFSLGSIGPGQQLLFSSKVLAKPVNYSL